MPRLDQLPPEIMARIATACAPRDRAALRGVSRDVRSAMSNIWPLEGDELKSYVYEGTPRQLYRAFGDNRNNKMLTRMAHVPVVGPRGNVTGWEYKQVNHPLVINAAKNEGLKRGYEIGDGRTWDVYVGHKDPRPYHGKSLGIGPVAKYSKIMTTHEPETKYINTEEQKYYAYIDPRPSRAKIRSQSALKNDADNPLDLIVASRDVRDTEMTERHDNQRTIEQWPGPQLPVHTADFVEDRIEELWDDMAKHKGHLRPTNARQGRCRRPNRWARAVSQARQHLGIRGFEPIRRGSALYQEAKRIANSGG